jgi:ketosteroid isomerase-like protein
VTLNADDLADRLAIQDLIARYSRAVDTRDWDGLGGLFAEGATIDYTALGGIRGGVEEIKRYLAGAFEMFASTQHLLGLPDIGVDGDVATAVTPCHNPLVLDGSDDPRILMCGLWYHETFVRTPEGWRISELREERCYMKFWPGRGEASGRDTESQ